MILSISIKIFYQCLCFISVSVYSCNIMPKYRKSAYITADFISININVCIYFCEAEILLSHMIPAATRRIPRSFWRLMLRKTKASKRMPAVSCPTKSSMVDSITFNRFNVIIEMIKATILK